MDLLERLKEIMIVNDHTHIFGTGSPDFENAGNFAKNITAEQILCDFSRINMIETAIALVGNDDIKKRNQLLLELYPGRRTTYPARAFARFYREVFDFYEDEITLTNAECLAEKIHQTVPIGTNVFYEYLAKLTNTEVWLCNHGWNENDYDVRIAGNKQFRWVPYIYPTLPEIFDWAEELNLEKPASATKVQAVITGASGFVGGFFSFAAEVVREKHRVWSMLPA